ncbi:hypothetical protein WJ968_17695 [Achromobacter xylosoxidans]
MPFGLFLLGTRRQRRQPTMFPGVRVGSQPSTLYNVTATSPVSYRAS